MNRGGPPVEDHRIVAASNTEASAFSWLQVRFMCHSPSTVCGHLSGCEDTSLQTQTTPDLHWQIGRNRKLRG